MKTLCLVLFFLLTFAIAKAQWIDQNPVPDGNDLWSTFFIDDNTGWIVGSNGFIKKTTNAGLDWIQKNSGTTLTLTSVQFINQNIGWICGEGGLIIKTTNGGQDWFDLTSGTVEILTHLQFLNVDIGYVVGYNETILKTTDGGSNWVSQHSGSNYDLYSVDFVDALVGYAVGMSTNIILKTTDGGLNWIDKTSNLIFYDYEWQIQCVNFINSEVGFIGLGCFGSSDGERTIYKTTNGGESWTECEFRSNTLNKTSTFDYQSGIRAIYFKDTNNGYAVGGVLGWSRRIYTTTDGGNTWINKYGASEQSALRSVFVNDAGKGWAVGQFGVIFITEDNGDSWSQIFSGKGGLYSATIRITALFCLNDYIGFAGGWNESGDYDYPVILKTTNGGKFWKQLANFQPMMIPPSQIFFINENIGWVVLGMGSIYKTTDGGNNWFYASSPDMEPNIYFLDENIGWTISSYGSGIQKSTDGGINWVPKNAFSGNSINFSDMNNGWAVGAGGGIVKTTNAGETWFSKTSGTTANLKSVKFYNSSAGMCVGDGGTVLLSTNGGENWVSKTSGTTNSLNSVTFTNSTSAWVAGANGTILFTSDRGDNWTSYDNVTTNYLNDICFVNENTGWVLGESIYKYSIESCEPGWIAETNQQYNMSVIGLLKFDDVVSLNEEDLIGAFVGSECRGIASPIAAFDGKIFLTISSNQLSGETVTFKAWRSSTCEVLPVLGTIDFVNQGEVGTLADPHIFNGGMVELVYNFGSGYSWLSVNINPGNMGVNTVFNGLNASSNDRIIGQTSFAVYDAGSGQWIGSLVNLDYAQMYIMKLAIADEFTLQGLPVNPTTSPISLNPGYTWINYLPQTSMPINTALGNMSVTPTSNDRFIGQTQFAVYDGGSGQWIGSLLNLDPGVGYKIKLTNATVLTYPPNSFARTSLIEPLVKIEAVPDWIPVPNQQYNMQIVGEIAWDGVVSTNPNDMIGAFVGTECRGVAHPDGSGPFPNLFYLTVGSNQQSGEAVTFKVYHSGLDQIDDNPDYPAVSFVNQGEVGTFGNPFTVASPLPVELSSFTADIKNNQVNLKWQTATELNNYGFDIERKSLNEWQKIGFVQGNGNSNSPKEYLFTDNKLVGGSKYQYRLKQIDNDGQFAYSEVVEVKLIPTEFALYQNYPNPFNPLTTIRYQLPKESKVVIKIYNVLGAEVIELLNEQKEAGTYEVEFNAETLASGTYIYRIIAGDFVQTRKMILLK